MARLTDEELRKLQDGTVLRTNGALVRPIEDWQTILGRCATLHEAAARIVGDLTCYQADRGIKRRDGFLPDMENLARALQAWAIMTKQTTS